MHTLTINRNRGSHLPWIFFGGMLLVVAVNAVLIYFAFATWSGLATEHAYERGRGYNKALQAMERQEALGWSLAASLHKEAGGVALVIDATDRNALPLEGLALEVTMLRPLGAARTVKATLLPVGDGRYVARFDKLQRGLWEARITAIGGGERMLVTQRLTAS